MKVLLAHPGTQHSFHLAKQFYRLGILSSFHTGFVFGKDSWQKKALFFLPDSMKNKSSSRFLSDVPDCYIVRNLALEWKAQRELKKGRSVEEVYFERNKLFQESISDSSIKAADVVIGFDTSSWILARRCNELGKKFILDVTIAHPYEKQKVYENINEQFPEWQFSLKQKSQYLIDLELQEFQMANALVVASSFCRDTLVKQAVDASKIFVNPYGTDRLHFAPIPKDDEEVIKYVFVGLIDARKGIPLLLEAWKRLDRSQAQLTLIGPISTSVEALIRKQFPEIKITGKILHKDLPNELSKHDVFVFPSYFEGYALVIPEAMACGLTVITTPATCGPDIIKEGQSGFIVRSGDANSLFDKMNLLLSNRCLLKRMQQEAVNSLKGLSWNEYGNRWGSIIASC